MWTIFKVFTESVTILLLFIYLFFDHEACGILVPQPGNEPSYPTLKDEVLTTGPQGKSPSLTLFPFLTLVENLDMLEYLQHRLELQRVSG